MMRLSSCVPLRVPPAQASVQSALILSSVAALASRSPRFFARSSESLRRARAAEAARAAARPETGFTSPVPGGTLTGQSRAAKPALVTLDSLFAFVRPALLRGVACASSGPAARCLPVAESVLLMPTSLKVIADHSPEASGRPVFLADSSFFSVSHSLFFLYLPLSLNLLSPSLPLDSLFSYYFSFPLFLSLSIS